MGVFDEGYTQALLDAARQPVSRPPAGFLESYSATYEATRQEDLSISERQNFLDKVKQRNEKILELTGQPFTANPNEPGLTQPGQLNTTIERARLSAGRQIRELANRFPDIKTDEDLLEEIIEDSRRIREKTESVLSNTTFGGKVGSFTGAMAATLTDPLVFGTIPFGASTSAGIIRTALTEAGIGALSEAMIQPFVYRYKEKLDSSYDLSDAATRIAAAGVGSGALAGTVKGGFKLFSHLARPRLEGVDDLLEAFEKNVTQPTPDQRDAAFVLGDYADVLRENPFVIGNDKTTLYRVESRPTRWVKPGTDKSATSANVEGRWFTDDPTLVDWFLERSESDARVYAVRESTEELGRFRAENLPEARKFSVFPDREYFLPRDLADKKVEVTRPYATQPESDDIHLRATAKAIGDLDAGRPVDVQEFVKGMGFPDLPETFPRTIAGPVAPRVATENQSLGQFVKNSGGVAVDKAGALRGEYDALFEGGGRTAGAVKRRAGESPDKMAQLAHEAGFIDEPDPVLLAEALDRDLRGDKVYSFQGDRFERKIDLESERQYQAWVEMEEASYLKELELKARGILETEDIELPAGELIDDAGNVSPVIRSARELLEEIDGDTRAGNIIRDCLIRG